MSNILDFKLTEVEDVVVKTLHSSSFCAPKKNASTITVDNQIFST